ncbi:MAG: hypothetical protein DRZ79_06545 [Candidatus Cloacimonadota bacterium]|nr:MAG: hypothetical protein DRZ79_06545 [Candidatus Cloacimonadota bacterium]
MKIDKNFSAKSKIFCGNEYLKSQKIKKSNNTMITKKLNLKIDFRFWCPKIVLDTKKPKLDLALMRAHSSIG